MKEKTKDNLAALMAGWCGYGLIGGVFYAFCVYLWPWICRLLFGPVG